MPRKPTRIERWVAAFDVHGDEQCPATVAAFKAFCASFKPDVRIAGGDMFDFRWLRKSASDEEKSTDVRNDLEMGLDFCRWFRPTAFLWGNHDHRIVRELDATEGIRRSNAAAWIGAIEDATPKAKHYPWCKQRGVMRYADYAFVHGYCHGVGACRKSALTYGNVIMGHVHRRDMASVEGIPTRYGHSSGCLCKLDMDYTRGNMGTLAHSNGWVYGWRIGDRLVVMHAENVGGVWVYPTDQPGASL